MRAHPPDSPGSDPKDGRFLIKQLIVINFWFLLLRPGLFPWQRPLILLLGCASFTQQVKPRAVRAGRWSAFIFSGPSTKVSWGHQKSKGNYFSSAGLKVHRLLLGPLYGWPSAFNAQSSFLSSEWIRMIEQWWCTPMPETQNRKPNICLFCKATISIIYSWNQLENPMHKRFPIS